MAGAGRAGLEPQLLWPGWGRWRRCGGNNESKTSQIAWICRGLHSCPLFAGRFDSGHCPALARPYVGIDGVGTLCEVWGWQGLLSLHFE